MLTFLCFQASLLSCHKCWPKTWPNHMAWSLYLRTMVELLTPSCFHKKRTSNSFNQSEEILFVYSLSRDARVDCFYAWINFKNTLDFMRYMILLAKGTQSYFSWLISWPSILLQYVLIYRVYQSEPVETKWLWGIEGPTFFWLMVPSGFRRFGHLCFIN